MAGQRESEPARPGGMPTRGRGAIAASILAVLLIGGYFAASPGDVPGMPAEFVVNAVVLCLAFWFPAMKVSGPGHLLAEWKTLVPWLLAWTTVWDLATSGIVGRRDLFQEWWLVYPSGLVVLLLLLLFHAYIVKRVGGASDD